MMKQKRRYYEYRVGCAMAVYLLILMTLADLVLFGIGGLVLRMPVMQLLYFVVYMLAVNGLVGVFVVSTSWIRMPDYGVKVVVDDAEMEEKK